MGFGAAEEQIINAAKNYTVLLQKAEAFISQATDDLLSGSPATVYLKKMGHRQLTTEDFERIIQALGSEEDKRTLVDFEQAQISLSQRMLNTKNIGLVLKQANVPYQQAYSRFSRPSLWKPEQMIQIIEVLRRLQV